MEQKSSTDSGQQIKELLLTSKLSTIQYNNTAFYLPLAVFIAQVPMGPSKQLKQIFKLNITVIKFPTGQRQTSWLFTSVA